MVKFKLGVVIGFLAGWAVGSGKAAEMVRQMRASASESPGVVASRVPRPTSDTAGDSTAVSA